MSENFRSSRSCVSTLRSKPGVRGHRDRPSLSAGLSCTDRHRVCRLRYCSTGSTTLCRGHQMRCATGGLSRAILRARRRARTARRTSRRGRSGRPCHGRRPSRGSYEGDRARRVSTRTVTRGTQSRIAYECIERIGAPMSTVRRPILETSGPTDHQGVHGQWATAREVERFQMERKGAQLVDPQAMSFRTRYSCNGTLASAAILRRGNTVCEVVA